MATSSTKKKKNKFEETLSKLQSKYGADDEESKSTKPASNSENGNGSTDASASKSTNRSTSSQSVPKAKKKSKFESTLAKLKAKYDEDAPVDSIYINTFMDEAQSFLNRSANKVNNLSWSSANSGSVYDSWHKEYSSLQEKEEKIRSYLRQNKDSMDSSAYKQISSLLDTFHWSSVDAKVAFNKAKKHYSQWKTEDEYNTWKKETEEYEAMMSYDTKNGAKEIEDLEKVLNEYKALSRTMIDDRMQARLDYITANYGDEKGIKDKITQKKAYGEQAERLQEGVRLSSVGDRNSEYYDPEYDYWAKTRGKLPTQEDLSAYDSMMDQSKWYTDDNGRLFDAYGTEIDPYNTDENGNILHPSQGSVDSSDKLGIFLSASEDDVSQATATYLNTGGTWETIVAEGSQRHWDQMEESEINTYYYYLNKDGSEAAEKYLDSIQETLNRREGESMAMAMKDKTALEILFGVAAGLDQFNSGTQGLRNAIVGNDEYVPATATQYASSMVREDLADQSIPVWYNFKDKQWESEIFGSSVGQTAYDAITTTTNMLPSILTSVAVNAVAPGVGGAVGTGLLSASAGGNAYTEMINLGYDKHQSRTYATMVGASEAVLQSLLGGVSQLGGGAISKGVAKVLGKADNVLAKIAIKFGDSALGKVIINAAEEGSEEYLQAILEPWFKNIIFGEENEIDLRSEEALYSALLGALTGGVFEGSGIALDAANNNAMLRDTGKAIVRADGGVDALKALAMDVSGANPKLSALANKVSSEPATGKGLGKVVAAVKNSNNQKKVGRLYQAVEAEVTAQNQADVAKALNENGFSKSSAKNIAEALVAQANGEKLNKFQEAVLESVKGNKMVDEIVDKLYKDMGSSVNKRDVNLAKYNLGISLGVGIAPNDSRTNPAGQGKEIKSTKGNLTPEEEIGSEGVYEVSAEGKTLYNGEAVSVQEVADVNDGVMTLRLEDGRTVNASDVVYASKDEALLYETIANMGASVKAANILVNGFKNQTGMSASVYAAGIHEAFRYGRQNIPKSELASSSFASNLNPGQREYAYRQGQKVAGREVAQAQAVAENATTDKDTNVPRKSGKVHTDRVKVVSYRQEAAVETAEIIASITGRDIYFFESYRDKNGNLVFMDSDGIVKPARDNGWYDPNDGTIHLDINAGQYGRKTVLYTMAHELIHMIKDQSPKDFAILANYLMKQLGTHVNEDGSPVNVEALIQEQVEIQVANGYGAEYYMKKYGMTRVQAESALQDAAYEEVVCEAMETVLNSGRVQETLVDMQQQGGRLAKLAQDILDFLKDIINKLKTYLADYEGVDPNSTAGKIVASMNEDVIAEFEYIVTQGLLNAGENMQISNLTTEPNTDVLPVEQTTKHSFKSLAEAAGFEAVENADGTRSFVRDGAKVTEITVEDIENSPIGAMINYSLEMKDITKADADRQKKMFAEICSLAAKTNDFSMTMTFMGSAVFTGMKANADKQYGTTYDFPSICTKTQAVIDAMSKSMVELKRGLNQDELLELYRDVFASGNPVPCPECYVFSRWIGVGGLLDNIYKYQQYYGKLGAEESAKVYRKMYGEVEAYAAEQGLTFGKAKGALTSKVTKEYIKLLEKVEKADNQGEKVKDSDRTKLASLEKQMNTVKAMTWLENVYFSQNPMLHQVPKLNPRNSVPVEILFDLNNGEAFATQYPEAWAFRTTQGAGYGKAITPYAEATLGEGILTTNNTSKTIKDKAAGNLNNIFLQQNGGMDTNAKKALARARAKQKIQAFLGGQRFQSTSDARFENASDYLLAALEMQAMGGMVQCYTKVDGAVPAFGAWGFSINQSLMPLGGGLDADGNITDTSVGGMNPKVAFRNREKHESAGTITIGVNDNHIRALFREWVRDFIIPYHASGGKADLIAGFRSVQDKQAKRGTFVRSTDYSRVQGDKILSDVVLRWQGKTDAEIEQIHARRAARIAILTGGKPNMDVVVGSEFLTNLYRKFNGGEWDGVKVAKGKVETQIFPNEFWDQSVTYENSQKITEDYLAYCDELGILHRFSGLVPKDGVLKPVNGYDQFGNRVQLQDLAYQYDENGNKTDKVEPFFWKVLTDRRMYDNSGNYLPQKRVTLNDTTKDTVTYFATNNYGRQYDSELARKTAEAISKKMLKYQSKVDGEVKDATQLTEDDLWHLLEQVENRQLSNSTFVPLRATTPQFLIDVVREHSKGKVVVKDLPMASIVKHLAQNMEEDDGSSYGEERPHGLDKSDIIAISKEMGHPSYITLQKNGRYAEVVSFYNSRRKRVVVSISFADDKNNYKYAQYMNGFNEGYYNIIVTQYEPDSLKSYLDGCEIVYDKQKMNGKYQVGSGRVVTFTHDTPFVVTVPQDSNGVKQDESETNENSPAYTGEYPKGIKFQHKEDDPQKLKDLNGQVERGEYTTVYKALLRVGDKYYPPMASLEQDENGKYTKLRGGQKLFDWIASDGILTDEMKAKMKMKSPKAWLNKYADAFKSGFNPWGMYGDFKLKKADETGKSKGDVPAAYNPYQHSSDLVLNDQFAAAYDRPGLVVVECRIPNSELTNPYWAPYAKDPTGMHDWKTGPIADQLMKTTRHVYMTRWIQPVRELSPKEVAQKIRDIVMQEDTMPRVYWNTLNPYVLKELIALGVEVDPYGSPTYLSSNNNPLDMYGNPVTEEMQAKLKAERKAEAEARDRAKKTAKKAPKKNIHHQFRNEDSMSNRSLLANAFEGLAQHDIEKQKLQEYKGNIALIDAEEQKLHELNEQIKELSFAKGPKDTKKIRDLQFEAKQTANRIDTYDRILLNLESSKPLKNVLDRAKKAAYKRAEQKGKENLAAYKERVAKTQRELIEKWQDSRKKGIESRQKTAMRHKIKDVVNELNQYLLRGTKDRHVPIELQKAVAEALDAVNMDTVGADERIAKLQAELLKAKTPEKIQEISRKIDHIREMGDRMNGRLRKLKDAYDQFVNSDDPMIANSHDEVISNKLQAVIESVGDTPLRDMSIAQLEDVYDMYRMVLTTIRNTNKAFKAKKSESISIIANQVMAEVEKVGGKKKQSLAMLNGVKNFGWNNLKPVYAFEHIGSDHFTEVFNNVRAGEDVWALDVTEAREFYLDKSKKHGYDSWDFKKRYKFTSTSGMDFDLNLEQIMSLYAYSKRDQAADHLKRGGIVFDDSIKVRDEVKIGPFKLEADVAMTDATAYNISDATLAEIISKLTADQKDFVDVMQDYLSTVMGAKGNEVSLEMYGVKLFKEKFYFPLKSAQQFMAKAKEQQKGEVKIKNSGFSKETVQKASNPIVLTPFMNVWADHVNEMSMYHAFVLPMEDFYRVYNYKTPTSDTMATESVEMFIQNAYGKGATKYIDQLLKDLNGGTRTDHTTGFINKMMGRFKKGAVFASLSVVVQQPSAIARAAALVDTKYFIGPKVDHKRHALLWDEVKQYAPVAVIKEMGYFDTNMGKSTQDFILGKEYSGFKDKMKALFTDSGYRDEALSKAPALADEIAWCSIWEAVKRETKAKYPGLDTKAEPFLKLCGSRFTEVIVKTQVYDSVLSRSGLMRSKDTGMKMATAFMAEPTTSINMIADALLKGKRGNRKYARGAIGAVIASQILNSILVSFVYAGRDDDEDETYWEKYIGTLSGEILDSLNPAGYIPFIKDMISIFKGYDVERSDMAVISDLWKAIENLKKDTVSPYRKVEGFVGSIAQIFGLPVKNIMRDTRGIYQTIMSFVEGQQTTKAGIGYAVKGAITGKTVSNDQQLYEAILSGDQTQIARVKGRYDDASAVNSAMRSAIKEHFLAGDIDSDTAIKYMVDYCGDEESDAFWKVEEWNHDSKSEEDFAKYNEFYGAVQTGKNLKATIKKYTDNGVTEATLKSQLSEHFKPLYIEMTSSEKAGIKGYLLNAMALLGDDREAAEAKISKWEFEGKHGFNYDDRILQFKEGNISASNMKAIIMEVEGKTEKEANSNIVSYTREAYEEGFFSRFQAASIMVDHGGLTSAEAENKLRYIDVKKQLPDTYVDDAWVEEYYKEVESSGIPIEVFVDYRNQVKGITGEGKKEKRMAVINSMPISKAQKDALYYAEGWVASRLHEAPWR